MTLGFNIDNLLIISLPDIDQTNKFLTFKAELLKISGVRQSSMTSFCPPSIGTQYGNGEVYTPQNHNKISLNYIVSDLDYIKTLQLKLNSGKNYTDVSTDYLKGKVILNETASELLGYKNPVGQQVIIGGESKEILGVVKDFHTCSLHSKIFPFFLRSCENILATKK